LSAFDAAEHIDDLLIIPIMPEALILAAMNEIADVQAKVDCNGASKGAE
jgi:hypothetical protein